MNWTSSASLNPCDSCSCEQYSTRRICGADNWLDSPLRIPALFIAVMFHHREPLRPPHLVEVILMMSDRRHSGFSQSAAGGHYVPKASENSPAQEFNSFLHNWVAAGQTPLTLRELFRAGGAAWLVCKPIAPAVTLARRADRVRSFPQAVAARARRARWERYLAASHSDADPACHLRQAK